VLENVITAAFQPQLVLAASVSTMQRVRLSDALRGRSELRFVASFDGVLAMLRDTIEGADVAVIVPRDASGAIGAHLARHILASRPRTAIVAYCHAGSNNSADVVAFSEAGVHQIVLLGIDDAGVALRAALIMARQQCAADWVMSQLTPLVPVILRPMVAVALAHPSDVTDVASLADEMKVHIRTLFYRCERAAFTPPAELLVWVRLALVAHLLESTSCSITTIANELSYPSVTALRNAMKRYTGHRASEVRTQGGIRVVIDAMGRRTQHLS
jgi:AraC-like DNA-binding protein